jgi:hypothetical protein
MNVLGAIKFHLKHSGMYVCGNIWQLSNIENTDNLEQKTPLVIYFLTIFVDIGALKRKVGIISLC